MAVTTTIPPGARSSSPCSAASGPPPPNRCCDSGRPLYTDPTTGQTICSCQHEQMLNYQRIAQASLMGGPGGLPLPMYNSPYAEGLPAAAYLPGADQSHFYPNLVSVNEKPLRCLCDERTTTTTTINKWKVQIVFQCNQSEFRQIRASHFKWDDFQFFLFSASTIDIEGRTYKVRQNHIIRMLLLCYFNDAKCTG